ncbi:hypothetical protein A9G45_04375 [Gilliamella sp. HK2]|uniref:hypothetical protein n=1 Tax=unclassified Gilliamella TaxID=2685620 RepID=UPI00080E4CB4|nr:hypothetical protein [Gilliamella apicola]OCG29466.1 hypothetical protein A9G45_04375 [Gilliamella apicola]OCG30504.1 hypothetical protein A9G46_11715 [Gilliamella apicola]
MLKKVSTKLKQQATNYALPNTYLLLGVIANHLDIGKPMIYNLIRQINAGKTSKLKLISEQQKL